MSEWVTIPDGAVCIPCAYRFGLLPEWGYVVIGAREQS